MVSVTLIDSYTKLLAYEDKWSLEIPSIVSGPCRLYVAELPSTMAATIYVGEELAAGEIVHDPLSQIKERAKMLQEVALWLRDTMHITKFVWPSAAKPLVMRTRAGMCYGPHIAYSLRATPQQWNVVHQQPFQPKASLDTTTRHAFVRDCFLLAKNRALSFMDVDWFVPAHDPAPVANMNKDKTPVMTMYFAEEIRLAADGQWEEIADEAKISLQFVME